MKESWGRCDKDGNPIWVDRGPGAGVPRTRAYKSRHGKSLVELEDGAGTRDGQRMWQDNRDADRAEDTRLDV